VENNIINNVLIILQLYITIFQHEMDTVKHTGHRIVVVSICNNDNNGFI